MLGAQNKVHYGTSAVVLHITHIPRSTAPAMALTIVDDIMDMIAEWSSAENLARLGDTVRITKEMLSRALLSFFNKLSTLSFIVYEDKSYQYRISASSSMPLGVVHYRNATFTYSTIGEHERQFPEYQGMTYTVTSSVCLVRRANDNRTEVALLLLSFTEAFTCRKSTTTL